MELNNYAGLRVKLRGVYNIINSHFKAFYFL
jgi:hypothetical protein